jgi:hypothetical protein
MGFLARASALFVGASRFQSYHEALLVEKDREAALKSAQREIRQTLREAARKIPLEGRFWRGRLMTIAASQRPSIVPKFKTQGSVDYDLLVEPWHLPPQQIDLDDGVYFNVEYLDSGEPALVAEELYQFIEEALGPLCKARGWYMPEKDCCVRVQIALDAHIDLPIYSAPRRVTESIALEAQDTALAKRSGERYRRLPSNKIMLAYRDGTWTQSDPLRMKDWVDACVTRYGQDFRRVCRYLKGWRDQRWAKSCLTSITLMVAVEKALAMLNGGHRALPDDHLLYEVAQRLPGILRGELLNPVFPGQRIVLNNWSSEDRDAVIGSAEALAADLHSALKGTHDATLVVESLRRALGTRIPYRPDAVEMMPTIAAKVVAERPAKVASPAVSASTSG